MILIIFISFFGIIVLMGKIWTGMLYVFPTVVKVSI